MSNILNECDVKGIEEHLNSLSKEGVMKITINLFKGYGELADKHNQLESVLNEVRELVTNYEEVEKIIGAGKPMFPLHKLQKIIHEIGDKQ